MKRILLIFVLIFAPLIGSLIFNFLMDFYNIPTVRSKNPDPYNLFQNLSTLSFAGIIISFISLFSKKYNIYYKIFFLLLFIIGILFIFGTIDSMSRV